MVYTLRKCSAAFFVLASIFLLCPAPANAQPLTLPEQIAHDGLTFPPPLIFANDHKNIFNETTIAFTKPHSVEIKDKEKTQKVEALVVTPQVQKLNHVSAALPTPTIFIAQAGNQNIKAPAPTSKLFTPKPTTIPPTATQTPSTPTAPAVTANVGGLNAEKLFSMSNAYRQARGLAAFEKDDRACSLAASRAPEIAGEVTSGALHSGLQSRALPYWNSENIISMGSEEAAFNWWVNDKIHHDAIVGNYKYSCVACVGNNCAQEFTNFQPK